MIQSKKDYKYYLECDRKARNFEKKCYLLPKGEVPIYKFQRLMRKTEYYNNCRRDLLGRIVLIYLKLKYKKEQIKYGFTIPINTFGPGLCIMHRGTIIVSGKTKIGKNCRINADVCIGVQMGTADEAPIIGDNCFIASGVKMFGKIKIGDNVAIGVNSVVNKSFDNNVAIAGVPAKVINTQGTQGKFLFYVE